MKKLLALLYESVTDVTKRVDGKLLTIAAVAFIVVATYPVGWVFNRWPPEYIWTPTLLFLAAGLGIDAYVTRAKIQAEAPPAPTVQVQNVEEVKVEGQA